MKVVVLCGGLGTRLREESEFRPKPMVEIGGRPILWHIMKTYAHYGFREFVLCLGYRGNMIKDYFLNYEAMNNDFSICLGQPANIRYHGHHTEQGFTVTLAETGLNTMTGGRIRRIEKYIDSDLFLLTYGDGLSDVDIRALLEFHHSHGKIATVTTVPPISRFGVVKINDSGVVERFTEKPKGNGSISAGFFVLNRAVFDYLGDGDYIFEREPLERLSAEGQLMAYRHRGFFYGMDTFREYQYLNELWNSGAAPWKVWNNGELAQ
ncbi:MAG: glucose-1-phosphate cytidylyltransferase [Bryobacteraceae bacterium]|jgi:glucose-1-phosphate cytidylyltransferase